MATVGPATDRPGMMERLFAAGVDVFRVNYSHQTQDEHARRVREIREVSERHERSVAIIGDLQGPKIRIGHFHEGKVDLQEGSTFVIDTDLPANAGNEKHVGVSYKALPQDVREGDTLLLDDGRIVLSVQSIEGNEVLCEVVTGGELGDSKGVNLHGGGLSANSLTQKDEQDLDHAINIGVDYIAVSFVRSAEDVIFARHLISQRKGSAKIIAKIERSEAIENIESIIGASDAIMIARGDLGVEIGGASLPPVQKRLIALARRMDRIVITATQMMESMVTHQIPTRAEVFDVANAVLDGTDAVMLSAESSIGNYPDKAVLHMSGICEETEKQAAIRTSDHRVNQRFSHIDETIAMSAMYAANHIRAKAIIAITETGSTCQWMSRISSGIPIFAFTRHEATRRRVTLYRGVYPVKFDVTTTDPQLANREVIALLRQKGMLDEGDCVLITKGDLLGKRGGTNSIKLIQVGADAALA